MKIHERKLQEISGSILVSLPKKWADQYHLKKGGRIQIGEAGNKLQIAPKIEHEHKKSREVIEYDANFIRRFFRLYLKGVDEIVIKKNTSFSKKEKEEVQTALNRFMNVQIIEDQADKIVAQNFDITDLTIKQCLKRMFFLTKNMFTGIFGEAEDIETIDASLHKFYFLLVRLIRKDLDEGLYVEKNMHLIRYMDYRMVGEKIERIGDILKKIASENKDKKIIEQLKFIEKNYDNAFNAFVKEDFETAIEIWNKRTELNKKFPEANQEIKQIYRFTIEISKFIR